MSKIGDKPITINNETEIDIQKGLVHIKGKEGQLSVSIPKKIAVVQEDKMLCIKRANDDKKTKALQGLIRSLINNGVLGVNQLWRKRLQVTGTGYRVKLQGEDLVFEVGYSHKIIFKKTANIIFTVEGNNKLSVVGIDKQLVGEVAEKIKRIKKRDPYKGKGIGEEGERFKLRPGKKAKTAGAAK